MTLSAHSLSIAQSQIGVFEHPLGSNAGPEVDKYLAAAGGTPGEPWCMSFVQWCVERALYPAASPLHRSPGVLDVWQHTPAAAKVTSADVRNGVKDLQPGYVFIIDHGGGHGHTGFVVKGDDGPLTTVEGNTNTDGSANGIGVFQLTSRNTANPQIIGYIDLDAL